jgi:hypothetical protein
MQLCTLILPCAYCNLILTCFGMIEIWKWFFSTIPQRYSGTEFRTLLCLSAADSTIFYSHPWKIGWLSSEYGWLFSLDQSIHLPDTWLVHVPSQFQRMCLLLMFIKRRRIHPPAAADVHQAVLTPWTLGSFFSLEQFHHSQEHCFTWHALIKWADASALGTATYWTFDVRPIWTLLNGS